MTIRTFTMVVSLDDQNREFKSDEDCAKQLQQLLASDDFFARIDVMPGIFIPGVEICDAHKALKK